MQLATIGIYTRLLAVTRTKDLAPEYVAPIEAGPSFLPWMVGLVVVVAVASVTFFAVRRMRIPVIPMNDDLTLELCRAHGIGVQHRSSLDHVAHLAGLPSPAQMFLSAKLFDEAVAQASQAKRLGLRQRGLIFEVRHCLYG